MLNLNNVRVNLPFKIRENIQIISLEKNIGKYLDNEK